MDSLNASWSGKDCIRSQLMTILSSGVNVAGVVTFIVDIITSLLGACAYTCLKRSSNGGDINDIEDLYGGGKYLMRFVIAQTVLLTKARRRVLILEAKSTDGE